MLTSLKISSISDSLDLTGICNIVGSDSIALSVEDPNSLYISLSEHTLNRTPQVFFEEAIYSINGVQPDAQTGKFYLLGSTCTSISDFTDATDNKSHTSDAHTLTIFDGCFPCDTCGTLAQLQEDIQNCQIWINGLKDCSLYYEPASARLWNEMLNKKVIQASSCQLSSDMVQNRQKDFGQAIKLLYQYKAVIAMWNYLVRTKAGMTQILQAPQDYSGFIIQSKRNIDSCGRDSAGQPTFRVIVALQTGQVPSYLQTIGCGMGFYISKQEENSYIEYGRDSGMAREQDSSNIAMQVVRVVNTADDTIQIQILFTFTPTKQAASIFSAGIKILPVLYTLGYPYQAQDINGNIIIYQAPDDSPAQILLDQWVSWRSSATSIEQALQTRKNRWFIQTTWTMFPEQSPVQQTFYYHTAYSKHPAEPSSDSGSLST